MKQYVYIESLIGDCTVKYYGYYSTCRRCEIGTCEFTFSDFVIVDAIYFSNDHPSRWRPIRVLGLHFNKEHFSFCDIDKSVITALEVMNA